MSELHAAPLVSVAGSDLGREGRASHEELLDEVLKRLAAELASALVISPNRKQQRIAFEEYVTKCLVERLSAAAGSERADDIREAELEDDPFARLYLSARGGAEPDWMRPSEGFPAKLLAQRDALMSEARASREAEAPSGSSGSPAGTITDAELLRALNIADDPSFLQIKELTRRVHHAKRSLTAPEWSTWPRGSWATVCDDRLLGPFPSHEAAIAEVKRTGRSCFGACSWQVGVPPEALIL